MRRQLIGAVFSSKTADAVLSVLAEAFEADRRNPLEARLKAIEDAAAPVQPAPPTFMTQSDDLSEGNITEQESKPDVGAPAVRIGTAVAIGGSGEPAAAGALETGRPGSSDAHMEAVPVDRTRLSQDAYEAACASRHLIPVSRRVPCLL